MASKNDIDLGRFAVFIVKASNKMVVPIVLRRPTAFSFAVFSVLGLFFVGLRLFFQTTVIPSCYRL